jgi:hypothetical protein
MRLVLALFLFTPVALVAQSSTLRGVVTDESGALVPGARVTLTATGGAARTADSDANGVYSFSGLPAGNYAVQAAAPQLALAQTRNITLTTAAQTLNLQLQVAATVQRVEVQAAQAPSARPPRPVRRPWSCAGTISTPCPTIPRICKRTCRP